MQEELKRALKKDTSRIGWGLIFYSIISTFIAVAVMSWTLAGIALEKGIADFTEQEIAMLSESGTGMIFAALIGVLFLILFMRKKVSLKKMFVPKKRMTAGVFFQLLAVFMASQLVFSYTAVLLESGLNLIGYTAMPSIEEATEGSQSFSMFLYAAFAGPIAEEMVYRGFVMEPLRKYGKIFAIVVSAVLFGVMHGNLPQSIFAIAVGLVFGYTALEYSMIWAIAIHITNNFIFGELVSLLHIVIGKTGEEIVRNIVVYGFFIIGIIILWRKRNEMRDYIAANKAEKGKYRYAFMTLPIVLFIAFHLFVALALLQPLA